MCAWFRRGPKVLRRRMVLEQLEERVVLDAAVAANPQDNPDQHTDQANSAGGDQAQPGAPAQVAGAAAPTEASGGGQPADPLGKVYAQELNVVLISNALGDVETISKAAVPDAKVIVYDAQRDDLGTVVHRLQDLTDLSGSKISHLALIDHGGDGVLQIGADRINSGNAWKFSSSLETLGTLLTTGGQIELYGCSTATGEAGQAFVNQIALLTHSAVFASTDATGSNGGNWTLEYGSNSNAVMFPLIQDAALEGSGSELTFPGRAPLDTPGSFMTYSGVIDNGDPWSVGRGTGYRCEIWTFTLSASTTVSIGMQNHSPSGPGPSEYFDTFLYLYNGAVPTSGGLVTFNDDWGSGTVIPYAYVYDSIIQSTLAPGTYSIEATTYSSGVTGPYQLLSTVQLNGLAPWNVQPLAAQIANTSAAEDFGTYSYDVHGYFSDNNGNALSYHLGSTSGSLQLDGLSINSTTGVISFTSHANAYGSLSIPVWADDGALNSLTRAFTFTANSVNDAPVLSGLGGTLLYTENTGAQLIDNDIALNDVDSVNMTRATIQITSNYTAGQDSLDIPVAYRVMGVTVTGSGTGTLSLSGSFTVAQYESMLEHVTYANSSDNPNTTPRTVSWSVYDGAAWSATPTSTVIVDPPELSGLGGTLAYAENSGQVVIDSDVTLTDPDNTNLASATVQITGNCQTGFDGLTIASSDRRGGVMSSYDWGTGRLTLTGITTIANYEYMLEHVKYYNNSDNPSTLLRSVTWTVNDGLANSTPESSAITVTAVNDRPQLYNVSSLDYVENDGTVRLDSDGSVTLSDYDNTSMAYATVQITGNYQPGEDILSIDPADVLSPAVTAAWDAGTGKLTLSGSDTIAHYKYMLEHVKYTDPLDTPTTATRTVTWIVNDGTDSCLPQLTTITVAAVNDIPEILPEEIPVLGAVNEGQASSTFILKAHDADLPADSNVNFVVNGIVVPGDAGDDALTAISLPTGTLTPQGYVSHDSGGTYSQQFTFTPNDGDSTVSLTYLFQSPKASVFSDTGQKLGSGYTNSVALGDIDGDGDLDMVQGNWGGATKVWLNDGKGVFTDSGQNLSAGLNLTKGIILADVDGINGLDIIAINSYEPNRIWTNNGSGGFGATPYDSFGTNVERPTGAAAVGDVDNDGDLDFVEAIKGGPMNLWVNSGNGKFSTSGTSVIDSVSRNNTAVALGYINNDLYLDIVQGVESSAGRIWINNQAGGFTFDAAHTLPSNTSYAISMADVDNDGDQDIVEAVYAGNNLVLKNDGTGAFTTWDTFAVPTYNSWMALGDVDHDGDLDAVNAVKSSPNAGNRLWINTGAATGSFDVSYEYKPFATCNQVAVGDLNGDGWVDFVTANWNAPTHVYLNSHDSNTVKMNITVNNVAPTVTLNPVVAINENGLTTMTGTITDPGTRDTFTMDVNWGDGSVVEPFAFGASAAGSQTFSLSHAYLDDDADDTYTISATVKDDDGGSGNATTTVRVNNLDPVFTGPIADQAINEGGTATVNFTGMFTDVPADTMTYAYQVDGVGPWLNVGTSTTFNLTYGDDGVHGVVVRATDDDGGTRDSNTVTITVDNVAPVEIPPIPDAATQEGVPTAPMNLHNFFNDVPADLPLTFTYDDGTGHSGPVADPAHFTLFYAQPGVYTVHVTANDGDGGITVATFHVVVADIPEPASDEAAGRQPDYEPLLVETTPLSGSLFGTSPVELGSLPPLGSPLPVFHSDADGSAEGIQTIGKSAGMESAQPFGTVIGDGGPGDSGAVHQTGGPVDHGPAQWTGLRGFLDGLDAGKKLVFNLDEISFTDLCTNCVMTVFGPTEHTGLHGYFEAIKAGKSLVFNLSEMNCLDLCSG